MNPARGRIHLHPSQRCANKSSRDPKTQVRRNMIRGIRNKESLHAARKNCEQSRPRKRSRPMPAKLRGTGHLFANVADVAKRSIEIVHGRVTLQSKVTP